MIVIAILLRKRRLEILAQWNLRLIFFYQHMNKSNRIKSYHTGGHHMAQDPKRKRLCARRAKGETLMGVFPPDGPAEADGPANPEVDSQEC